MTRSDLQRIRQRAALLVADIDEMLARMEEPPQSPQLVACFVYFMIRADGLIKIGYSNDPGRRRVQVCSPFIDDVEILAVIPGGRDEERAMHMRFARSRVRGEWFRDTPELRTVIAEAMPWDGPRGCPVGGWPRQ